MKATAGTLDAVLLTASVSLNIKQYINLLKPR